MHRFLLPERRNGCRHFISDERRKEEKKYDSRLHRPSRSKYCITSFGCTRKIYWTFRMSRVCCAFPFPYNFLTVSPQSTHKSAVVNVNFRFLQFLCLPGGFTGWCGAVELLLHLRWNEMYVPFAFRIQLEFNRLAGCWNHVKWPSSKMTTNDLILFNIFIYEYLFILFSWKQSFIQRIYATREKWYFAFFVFVNHRAAAVARFVGANFFGSCKWWSYISV